VEKLTVKQVLEPLGARLVRGAEDSEFRGVSIDSRSIKEGELFFPFAGQNCDAHQFILGALSNGAAGSIANKEWEAPNNFPPDKFLIVVDDVLQALQSLAGFYQEYLAPPFVIGITGSNGKTTTKDLIASVTKQKYITLKTQGNYNNEIGVPLTLLGLEKQHQVAVIEMGMRGLGEITELAEIIHPNLGVVTNVGETHLELLGSKEKIAQAKGELVAALPPSSPVVLNFDDPYVRDMSKMAQGPVLFYGLEEGAKIRGTNIQSQGEMGMNFTLLMDNQSIQVELPLLGLHNVYNALAAAAVGKVLGLSLEVIKRGLESVELTGMRLEIIDNKQGIKIINDTYNASPASMAAALHILEDLSIRRQGKSVAILGNMYELGAEQERAHQEMGELAARLGINNLVTIGNLAAEIAKGAVRSGMAEEKILICSSNQEALERIPPLSKGDTVLVKGSRGMKMEEIVGSFRD